MAGTVSGDAVPDFFVADSEPARRQQIGWLQTELGWTDRLLSSAVAVSEPQLRAWLSQDAPLAPFALDRIGRLWDMTRHIVALYDFDVVRIRELLDTEAVAPSNDASVPWAGKSIRGYIERAGSTAIEDVKRWVTSFRFSDRYAAPAAAAIESRNETPSGAMS